MNCGAEEIDFCAFADMLQTARCGFDYIFLDAPAGVDAGFRLAAQAADRCIVVTGAGPAAVRDASRVGDLLELMGKTGTRLVVNRIDRDMLSTVRVTIDDVMDISGLPLAGVVLEDVNVTLAASFGQPLLRYAKRCDAAKAFRRIARRVQGFPEPMKLR
jgi:septum site-determining protein MinD